ncbi:hypothetical protein Ahia01_000171200, partial [Argonauta hians]
MQPHLEHTIEIDPKEHDEIERTLNAHAEMWCKILQANRRTAWNFQSTHNPIPPLYGLRKDHKLTSSTSIGPPVRPVCGANAASNYRLSYLLSMILRPHILMSPDVCDSTEDLLSRIHQLNTTDNLTDCII